MLPVSGLIRHKSKGQFKRLSVALISRVMLYTCVERIPIFGFQLRFESRDDSYLISVLNFKFFVLTSHMTKLVL
jgi:hypothetical protein